MHKCLHEFHPSAVTLYCHRVEQRGSAGIRVNQGVTPQFHMLRLCRDSGANRGARTARLRGNCKIMWSCDSHMTSQSDKNKEHLMFSLDESWCELCGSKLCDYLYFQSNIHALCCILKSAGCCVCLIFCLGQSDLHGLTQTGSDIAENRPGAV